MYQKVIDFIRSAYNDNKFIPLHEPRFWGKESVYLHNVIESTFVSSVGEYVNLFEKMICEISGARFCVATVNGTAALHIALLLSGVNSGDEVITQAVSFVATSNAISYCGAVPIFIDVDYDTMGMSPDKLNRFFQQHTIKTKDGICRNKSTKKKISACVPMHTFGHPCRIDQIVEICKQNNVSVVEDAAESLGSLLNGTHTGVFGTAGIYSFNGNKTVTCGGGGAIVTNCENFAIIAKHLTTTAKVPHPYEYIHDQIGYNYRLPNLNAALACAQLEQLNYFIKCKRELASNYAQLFNSMDISVVSEPPFAFSNYWLNAIILPSLEERNKFLSLTNSVGVMTRPIWRLTNTLPAFNSCQTDDLHNSSKLANQVVNIPSSVPDSYRPTQ